MNIAAFDLSLTATGWATSYDLLGRPDDSRSGVMSPRDLRGMQRLACIRDRVLDRSEHADLVVLEGLAFGAKGNAMLDLAGLAAVIRLAIAERGSQRYVDIPPSSLKLFATGKGNAPKDEVLACAVRKLSYAGHDHNEADALWLLQMAQVKCGDLNGANEHQRRALAKIAWPEIGAGV